MGKALGLDSPGYSTHNKVNAQIRQFCYKQENFSGACGMGLMSFEEMRERYEKGEDSLNLALEKWERILTDSRTVFHISHFQDILKAAVVPLFLCVEYEKQCHICPIFSVCKQGNSEEWTNLMRVVQAYAFAGDLLPLDPYIGHVETFVNKLRMCHENQYARAN
jgi:hypothetical protein